MTTDREVLTFTGTVTSIHDHGTIVIVYVATTVESAGADASIPVYCDHSCFRHMWEARGQDMIGSEVEVAGTIGDGPQAVRFLDD